jgi:hypothetical protein
MRAAIGILAVAEKTDMCGASGIVALAYVAVLIAVAALAIAPIFAARRAGHGSVRGIAAAAIFWALAAAGAGISTASDRFRWAHEREIAIESGYYDPRAPGDEPPWPRGLAAGIGGAYAALWAYALAGGRARG